ncbi:hypothetical protein MYXO_03793 [Myxococcaceae bacterium]|nr:hypothetical protein MYXO_03793 [Myxococcaceae bacterium]
MRQALTCAALLAALVLAISARADEAPWPEYQSPKYGFALRLPPGFVLVEEDKTTTFRHVEDSDADGSPDRVLQIYVNWTWMPDVPSKTLFEINRKSELQDMSSPDPDYRDLIVFDRKKGYAQGENAYWFKEVDKNDPSEIHRWHAKAYGNESAYTVGLTGTYGQFERAGPDFEKVVKSLRLIPIPGTAR